MYNVNVYQREFFLVKLVNVIQPIIQPFGAIAILRRRRLMKDDKRSGSGPRASAVGILGQTLPTWIILDLDIIVRSVDLLCRQQTATGADFCTERRWEHWDLWS